MLTSDLGEPILARWRYVNELDTHLEVIDPATNPQDLSPFVLLGALGLFLLDLYAKRVRLFGYRTIKFR